MASKDTAIAAIMEQLMVEGPQAMAPVVTALMNLAMRMEREQFLGAGHYERSAGRRGYANGAKLKKIDTPAETLTLEVPKTAGTQLRLVRLRAHVLNDPCSIRQNKAGFNPIALDDPLRFLKRHQRKGSRESVGNCSRWGNYRNAQV